MHFYYLLIVLVTIAGPLALSFDKKVAFFSYYRTILSAIFWPALIYIIWDLVFTSMGIWEFNDAFILGPKLINLPFEEILFFIFIPYACLFIYQCLQVYFPTWQRPVWARIFTIVLAVLCIIVLVFNFTKLYTAVTAALLLITLINFIVYPTAYLTHAYISWIIAIVPMSIVNGLLTSLPILIYDNTQNLGIRLGTIPVEDFFYNLIFMLWMVGFFERRNNKRASRLLKRKAKKEAN